MRALCNSGEVLRPRPQCLSFSLTSCHSFRLAQQNTIFCMKVWKIGKVNAENDVHDKLTERCEKRCPFSNYYCFFSEIICFSLHFLCSPVIASRSTLLLDSVWIILFLSFNECQLTVESYEYIKSLINLEKIVFVAPLLQRNVNNCSNHIYFAYLLIIILSTNGTHTCLRSIRYGCGEWSS